MTLLLLVPAPALHAQVAARPLPVWQPPHVNSQQHPAGDVSLLNALPADTVRTRSHTGTGLLVGGLIGVAATTVFLIGFCDDPDTECGVDEVGRAVVFIAVPAAALGALIGSLVRTEE